MNKAAKLFFKILAWIIGVILAIVLVAACIWSKELKTMSSVKQVGDNPYLYSMQYTAKYDLDDVLASNIDSNQALLGYVLKKVAKGIPVNIDLSKKEEDTGEHCTSFQAKNVDGGYIFGRNYDFYKNPSLLTYSHPKNGYASITMSDMSHFGYGVEKLPTKLFSKALCLAAAYAPVDGMNEKGLCTSILALPSQPSQQSTGKPSVGTTIIMRLWLDRCATVDEALQLLSTVDVKHDVEAGSGYHYLVADAQGNSAIVEFDLFDGWKTMITRKAEGSEYQLVTNHLMDPKYYTEEPDPVLGNPHSKSWWRFATANEYLGSRNGVVSLAEAGECLANVHWKDLVWENGMIEDTQFSCVYDQKNLTLDLRSWYDYEKEKYHFELK